MSSKKEKSKEKSGDGGRRNSASSNEPDATKLYAVVRAMEIDISEDRFNSMMTRAPEKLAQLHKEIGQLQAVFKKTSPMRNMYKYDVRKGLVQRLYSTNHANIRIPETGFTQNLKEHAVLQSLATSDTERKMSDAALLYQLFENGTVPRRQDLLAPCTVDTVYYSDEATQECHPLNSTQGKKLLGAFVLLKANDNRKYASSASQECETLWKKREAALAIIAPGGTSGTAVTTVTTSSTTNDNVVASGKSIEKEKAKKKEKGKKEKKEKKEKTKDKKQKEKAKKKKSAHHSESSEEVTSEESYSTDSSSTSREKKAKTKEKSKAKTKTSHIVAKSSSSSSSEEKVKKKSPKKEEKKKTDHKRKREETPKVDVSTATPAPTNDKEVTKKAKLSEASTHAEKTVETPVTPVSPTKKSGGVTPVARKYNTLTEDPLAPPVESKTLVVEPRVRLEFARLSAWHEEAMRRANTRPVVSTPGDTSPHVH